MKKNAIHYWTIGPTKSQPQLFGFEVRVPYPVKDLLITHKYTLP